MLAVEVLVQSVVIAGSVLEEKRCRPGLTGQMTTLNEVLVLLRVAAEIRIAVFQRLAIGTRSG